MDGKNVILSAPTSFGKSVILDALVASRRWHNIVVIVPTVALIDEVRRRLVPFVDRYTVITHPSQAPGEDNIYVLTQERFLELPSVPRADLFMIDEFYKLGSSDADDQRMSMLNIAWRQLRSTGSQFYLTGPNISALAQALDDELQASLFVSDYRTVAVDVVDRSFVADDARLQDMVDLWPTLTGSTLVFASVPKRADRVAVDLGARAAVTPPTPLAIQVAEWVSNNYHPQWRVVLALSQGVASHSGPLPRSLQRMLIRLFESGDIRTMVCTTTLIEGVNTTAKNVIIYDKRIDRRPIDYFTFCNVRGRAGRMSNHFVGNVITYMSPPAAQTTEVDIPIDSQSRGAPLSSIVQLPPEDLTPASADRLEDVYNQEELSLTTIQRNIGYDPQLQVAAARRLRASRKLRQNLTGTGYPTNAQAKATLAFALDNLLTPRQRQRMTPPRLWGMLNAVRFNKGGLTTLVAQQARYKRDDEDPSDLVSQVLAFERNWMGFQIPSLLRALETIQRDVARGMAERTANYHRYITDIENLFMERSLLDLDEYGLPLPLALRMTELGMVTTENTAETLVSFVRTAQQADVRRQLSRIELWIIDDVLTGLGVQVQATR